jgi:hypothetical protein
MQGRRLFIFLHAQENEPKEGRPASTLLVGSHAETNTAAMNLLRFRQHCRSFVFVSSVCSPRSMMGFVRAE